jgi:ion channel
MTTGRPGRNHAGPSRASAQPSGASARPLRGSLRYSRTSARPATTARPGWRQRHELLRGSGDRFGLLLLVLVTAYLISAFTTGVLVSVAQIVLFLAATLLAMRTGRVGRRTMRLAIAVAVGGSAAAITLALTHSADAGSGVASMWGALILLLAVALIVRRVLIMPEVTLQSIFGAVSAYLIIGLMFASIYAGMYKFGGHEFFAHGELDNVKTFQYFSFTTLTTLGYGDFTAAGYGGQAVAVMEALLGQVFLATLVARLVSAFRGPREPGVPVAGRAGRRSPDLQQSSGHRRASKASGTSRAWSRTAQDRRSPGLPHGGDGPGRPADPRATRTSSPGRARQARRSPPHPER